MTIEGRMLRVLREKRELTQKQLAATAGLHHQTVGEIERGGRLTTEALVRLLSALEVEPFTFCMGVAKLRADDLDPLVAESRKEAGRKPVRGRRVVEFEWALGAVGEAIQAVFLGISWRR